MCGFAGVIAWDDKYRVTRDTLAKMSAAIAHRGPDGEGIYLNHEDEVTPGRPQVGLVHRRLAILDPDPRSNQPFTDGRHWLVFNGEIYNYRELRAELKGLLPNYEWRTNGDTEVLLASYAAWGEKCVEHLNGMFAIAIWDDEKQSLFLARDRMGQKPLYYTRRKGIVAFASEVHALRTAGFLEVIDSVTWLRHYLRYGYVDPQSGVASAYRQLDPSDALIVTFAQARHANYFDPLAPHDPHFEHFEYQGQPTPQFSSPVSETKRLVKQAVARQLVSDVPIGVFLSGGIDSSIVALCSTTFAKPLTFSVGFDDPRYDESPYADKVAAFLGCEHRNFRVTPNASNDLPRLAAVFGEPFADSSALPVHYLARETRNYVKVALGGDGGDELFGGYDRYFAHALAKRYGRFIPRSIAPIGRYFSKGHPKSRLTRLGRFLSSAALQDSERYDMYMRVFDDTLIGSLAGETLREYGLWPTGGEKVREWYIACRDAGNHSPVQAALATDRVTYLPGDLLTKVDRCSMLHALEVRSPFMDHELVRFAAGLTTDQLLKGGPKRMLREAFAQDLPDVVFKRKKMGFAVPIGEWFRTDANLKAMLIDHLFATNSFARGHFVMSVVQRLVDEHMNERVDHSQRLYALLMLELWWKTTKNV